MVLHRAGLGGFSPNGRIPRRGTTTTAQAAGMETVSNSLRSLGGVAPRRVLMRSGLSPRRLAGAVHRGEVQRVRQGWYALPGLPVEALEAIRVGGTVTATSAANLYGLWALDDGRLHVLVKPNASRLRGRTGTGTMRTDADAVCVHWTGADGAGAIAPVVSALVHAIECQSAESALVMIDSALNKGFVTRAQLLRVTEGMPRRYAEIVRRSDGGCQSGTETLVRLRLQLRGIRVETQFFRRGVGHVDLLVGERLVIECDSRFHDEGGQIERDYDRDIELIDGDYLVLRLRYRHVMLEWERIEAVILRLIRRGRHLRPRHR